jgi:hypothetical protein
MERAASRPEPIAELSGNRPAEMERARGQSLMQRSEGSRPGDADPRQVSETLEAPQGSLQARAEGAVERPRREGAGRA